MQERTVELPSLAEGSKYNHKARITVVENYYHQVLTKQPTGSNHTLTRYLKSDAQPYIRSAKLDPGVHTFDKGWLRSVDILRVEVTGDALVPSPDVRGEPCLEMCIYIFLSENERKTRTMLDRKVEPKLYPFARIVHGDRLTFDVCDFDILRMVNRTEGVIEVNYTLYGQ